MKPFILLLIVAFVPLGCAGTPSEGEKGAPTERKRSAGENPAKEEEIQANLAKLSPEDRKLAEAQRICPVANERLGSMDVPIKLDVKGLPVFICCKGCKFKVEKDPDAILTKVEELKKASH